MEHARTPDLIDTHTGSDRSEEHTSELQSLTNLVCRLLLEKKKKLLTSIPPLKDTTHKPERRYLRKRYRKTMCRRREPTLRQTSRLYVPGCYEVHTELQVH